MAPGSGCLLERVQRWWQVAVERHGVNVRARAIERRLEGPMLVAALLVVPAIAIEQSEAAGLLNTIAVVINWATYSRSWPKRS